MPSLTADAGCAELVLVAEDEPEIRRLIQLNLELAGYEVVVACDGQEALRQAIALRPALVLLDVMMPVLDGFEVCRHLRADARTSHIPVIILTAKTMTVDKVVGLTAGADDYVLKPFDPIELLARVRTTLRRSRELREISPLTGLPGNHILTLELTSRARAGRPLALIYADLNDFKPYNDQYGFLRGDGLILMTADVLQTAVARHGGVEAFVGHVGGDDFMVVCDAADFAAICEDSIAEFQRRLPAHYDPADHERGYLERPDRQGTRRRFPLVSIALGVASSGHGRFRDHRELVEVATEMKTYLKQRGGGSAYAVDGRMDFPDERSQVGAQGWSGAPRSQPLRAGPPDRP